MVTKHFQELQQRELRAEREDVMKMRRIAGSVAKMVREFWSNIEKVSDDGVSRVMRSLIVLVLLSSSVLCCCVLVVFPERELYQEKLFLAQKSIEIENMSYIHNEMSYFITLCQLSSIFRSLTCFVS